MTSMTESLPPGVVRLRSGGYGRVVTMSLDSGGTIQKLKNVALTKDEALAKRWDYYDPTNGWLLDGHKWAKDPEEWGLHPVQLQDSKLSKELPPEIAAQIVGYEGSED